MKVKEFIEHLKQTDQNAEVLISDENGGVVEVIGVAISDDEKNKSIIICDENMFDAFAPME